MILNLKTGIERTESRVVKENDAASRFGSEHMPVLATGMAVAFMEYTALTSVQEFLPYGYSSVGTQIDMKHIKPAIIGSKVYCHSLLTRVQGRRLFFDISLRDDNNLIATAKHERAVINDEVFKRNLQEK
jgi:fluoroacetyl-CoA thioesterase